MDVDVKSIVHDVFTNEIFAQELSDISKEIWTNPELGFKEYKAHDILTNFLENYGLTVERKYILSTAFRATFETAGSENGPHIAIMCEYDALPDIGHACGHNLIAEVGIAAGVALKTAMDDEGNKLTGKLTVLGTPAEEGLGGKVKLIDAGALETVDVAMMAHPSNKSIWRPKYLCLQGLNIQFTGKASHASSAPWNGVNALDAAVLCYQNISCLRQQMKPTWRVHGIIKNGGIAPNIIPEFSEMEYFIRAPIKGELDTIVDKVICCANGAATATGCSLNYKLIQPGYWSLISNNTLADLFEKNSKTLSLEEDSGLVRYGGSTDMGNISHIVPSIHPKFDIGARCHQHTRDFATAAGSPDAQEITLKIAECIALTAVDILQNPSLVQQMKSQLQEDLVQEHSTK
ncbi:xaa-Arg dipeptidase [Octopus bimaculoides]|uniref:Peptidase M20 domain-containing protein 2 n=1 Tax=Octopus bimaculoides TaxID=37653 RepID=A0A0L8HJQ8_OCTBM|nr:xaa-Arg dipeptidase [Octopus bimaculoides]|eukprot:XP_014771841.1 PREDICTED: peptidase M20 domain-containing protein 2-like [Octopus bimaculoides]